MNTPIEYALAYAALGWHVFPVKPNAKTPYPGSHGYKDATTDTDTIKSAFKHHPNANIGISMGKTAGIFAVDVDPRNNGKVSLKKICSINGALPNTVTAATGGNGQHYLFKYPDNATIPKQVLSDGIDIVSDGGYIIVAPSVHPNGNRYTWEEGFDPLTGHRPSEAPGWLLDMVAKNNSEDSLLIHDPMTTKNPPVHPLAEIHSALSKIHPDDYETWIKVGMALKSYGDIGLTTWRKWSQKSDKYKPEEINYKWESFDAEHKNGVTAATIFHLAREVSRYNQPIESPPDEITLPYPHVTLNQTKLAELKWDQLTPPEQEYLIVDKIPKGTTGLIAGTGGSSKTQLILQLSCGIAAGAGTFSSGNLTPPWQPDGAQKVLVLTAEESSDDLWRRIYSICQMSNYTPSELDNLRENLHIHSVSGINNLFTHRTPESEYAKTPNVDQLLEFIQQLDNPGLIVFEPISRFRSGDENNNESGTRIVEIMELVSNETGATVITASHTNKGTSSSDELNQDAIRGASSLVDGVRWAAVMRVMTLAEANKYGIDEEDKVNYVQFVIPKANNVTPQASQWFQRGKHGFIQLVQLYKPTTSKKADKYPATVKKILNFIKKKPPYTYSSRSLEVKHGGIKNTFGISQKVLRGMINRAVKEKLLLRDNKSMLSIPEKENKEEENAAKPTGTRELRQLPG